MNAPCLSCGKQTYTKSRERELNQWLANIVPKRHYPSVYSRFAGLTLCTACITRLPVITGHRCFRCGALGAAGQEQTPLCRDCRQWEDDPLEMNRSALAYDEWSRQMVARFKYKGDERWKSLFAAMLFLAYCRHYGSLSFLCVTSVPLHLSRISERGFNQAEQLARCLAEMTGARLVTLLARVKDTAKLSKQPGRPARIRSMADAFSPVNEAVCQVAARQKHKRVPPRILLVDDIFTTGATARACARTIRSVPALERAKIYSLTLCR